MIFRSRALIEGIKRHLAIYLLKGDQVYCPLCEWRGKEFYKTRCPRCFSLPRTRLIPFALQYFRVNAYRMHHVLLTSPSPAEFHWASHQKIGKHLVRLDLAFRPKKFDLQADLINIPVKQNCLDLVICWHVLEHIQQNQVAINELHQTLKPGGIALISVPIYPTNRINTYEDQNLSPHDFLKHYGHPDHVRACGLDYYQRFEKVGFVTSELRVNALSADSYEKDIKHMGLSGKHVVWCCQKSLN